MIDLTNSHSLTDFQRNARRLIDELNANQEPLLLTVNGKVQAVLVDPVAFQKMQQENTRQRVIAAIREAEQTLQEKPKCPVKEVFETIKDKYGL